MSKLSSLLSQSTFLTSSASYTDLPFIGAFDIAFSGRSNVGKSSLINLFTQRKKLAKTSKTPGKTQLLNCFSIEERFALIDLPGYGYANLSMTEAKNISSRIQNYLKHRSALSLLVLCIDVRRGFMPNDLEWVELISARNKISWLLLANKSDKLSQKERHHCQKSIEKTLINFSKPPIASVFTSAKSKEGIDTVYQVLENFLSDRGCEY